MCQSCSIALEQPRGHTASRGRAEIQTKVPWTQESILLTIVLHHLSRWAFSAPLFYEFFTGKEGLRHYMRSQPSIPTCSLLVLWIHAPAPELQQKLCTGLAFFFPLLWWLSGADLAKFLSLLPSKSQHIWSPAVVSIAQLSTAKMQSSESCCPMEIRERSLYGSALYTFVWISLLTHKDNGGVSGVHTEMWVAL